MESNGRLEGSSTEPDVAQERVKDRRGRKPGKGVHEAEPDRNVPADEDMTFDKKYFFINNRNRYTGRQVRQIVSHHRKLLRYEKKKNQDIKKVVHKKTYRLQAVSDRRQKRIDILRLKMSSMVKDKARAVNSLKKRLDVATKKLKELQKKDVKRIKEIRKKERAKLKEYYVVPGKKLELRYYDIVTWVKLYLKVAGIRKRTKMTTGEVASVLWLASYEEGTATSVKWSEDIGISTTSLGSFTKRLMKFGIVSREKKGRGYIYCLTERGKSFAFPMIEYLKKENRHVKKRKRQFVRNPVRPTPAATGVQDGGLQE